MEPLSQPTATVSILDPSPRYSFDPSEISKLLGDYYELLCRMHYFPRTHIKYPPHSPAINRTHAESLGLEPQVTDLLEKLPYVEGINNEDEFIMGGSFADFRKEETLEQSRDPDFASPQGGYEE